jgi:hypothetical protein
LADRFVPFTVLQVLVPGSAHYKPLATGLGTVAVELLFALGLTNHFQKRIGYKRWRKLHYLTFSVWGIALGHGVTAGTDRHTLWLQAIYAGSVLLVGGLLSMRLAKTRFALGFTLAPSFAAVLLALFLFNNAATQAHQLPTVAAPIAAAPRQLPPVAAPIAAVPVRAPAPFVRSISLSDKRGNTWTGAVEPGARVVFTANFLDQVERYEFGLLIAQQPSSEGGRARVIAQSTARAATTPGSAVRLAWKAKPGAYVVCALTSFAKQPNLCKPLRVGGGAASSGLDD